ncbi:protein-lysine N-methyltransferase EEF2KMT isoform X2 [Grus americana]|uniref:protein-lysine N-methyltransferase EEF2KMT isoform X2 n=1 Tax=Grus americana TaxID=9117 RepID=UPI0024081DF6|nr:protein-lysine N-methyltransferase EEF2KMT isoform X2 [Grus americana]
MAEPELPVRFQRRFLAARQLRSFPWPELEQNLRTSAGSALLVDILHKTLLHPLCVKYPPATKYRRCFLTELIKKHESTAAEPLDELYDTLADLLNEEESTRCYKNYLLPTGDAVTLSESVAIISGGTTGLITWDAALHLAEWAVGNAAIFSNRTVLELGSGIGFTGIAICKTCNPKTYVFSDCHPCVLKQLAENIRLNGFISEPKTTHRIQAESRGQEAEATNSLQPKIIVAELDWGSVTEKQLLDLQPDVIVAAERLENLPRSTSPSPFVTQTPIACSRLDLIKLGSDGRLFQPTATVSFSMTCNPT